MEFNYVYLITEIGSGLQYIGKRTSNVFPHLDLGIKYFGSPNVKWFSTLAKTNPNLFLFEVLSIHSCREQASIEECFQHELNNVSCSDKFINRVKATPIGFDAKGLKWTQTSKNKRMGSGNPMFGKESGMRKMAYLIEHNGYVKTAREFSEEIDFSARTIRKWARENKNGFKIVKRNLPKHIVKSRPHTDETKVKISEASKRNHSSYTSEKKQNICKKISESQIGIPKRK